MRKYMTICKMIAVVLTMGTLQAQANTAFALDLKPKAVECEFGNPDAASQFACGVQLAQSIELDNQGVLHLKANPNLCANPKLQDLQFSLVNARPDGVNVYELTSPQLADTPFKPFNAKGNFWIAVNSYFTFPKKTYPTNGVHPFIMAPLRVEKVNADGSTKAIFSSELRSELGWKLLSEVLVSTRTEKHDCGDQFDPNRVCYTEISTIEQSWLNQLSNQIVKVPREVKTP